MLIRFLDLRNNGASRDDWLTVSLGFNSFNLLRGKTITVSDDAGVEIQIVPKPYTRHKFEISMSSKRLEFMLDHFTPITELKIERVAQDTFHITALHDQQPPGEEPCVIRCGRAVSESHMLAIGNGLQAQIRC